VDLESAEPPEESRFVLEDLFHFHPAFHRGRAIDGKSVAKVEDYTPKEEDKFTPYLFHRDSWCGPTAAKTGVLRRASWIFFRGRTISSPITAGRAQDCNDNRRTGGKRHSACLPGRRDRVAHCLLDSIVENYKPALDELSLEISQHSNKRALQRPSRETLNRILQIKKRSDGTCRQIIGRNASAGANLRAVSLKLIRAHLVPYYRDVYDALYHSPVELVARSILLRYTCRIPVNESAYDCGQFSDVVERIVHVPVIWDGDERRMSLNTPRANRASTSRLRVL